MKTYQLAFILSALMIIACNTSTNPFSAAVFAATAALCALYGIKRMPK